MPHYNRILITGAAGRLGSQLRAGLAPLAKVIRLADRELLGPLAAHEEEAVFDLADMEATIAATEGCDAIVHFGGAPTERDKVALDPETVSDTIGVLLKYQDDIARIEQGEGRRILNEVKAELAAAE